MGTRQDTVKKADAYWAARQLMTQKEPYLLFTFLSADQARKALLALDVIHTAHDSGELTCTEPFTFGYY